MISFNLPNSRQLQIENDGARLRVIVLENGEEWVCRKESFNKLNEFISADEAHIFKGRLQLLKHDGKISIEVKGESVGVIDAGEVREKIMTLR